MIDSFIKILKYSIPLLTVSLFLASAPTARAFCIWDCGAVAETAAATGATAASTAASAASNAISAAANKALTYKEFTLDTIATMLAKSLMSQITKDTVKWIQTGFQGNPFIPEDYQKWARNAGDKVGGQFLDDLTNGKFSQFCSNPSLNIGLSLPQSEPFEIKTKCSLSDFGNNWKSAYDAAANGDWSAWLQISRPENNPYGLMLLSWEEKNRRVNTATTKEQTDLALNKGTLSLREHSTEADPVCIQKCNDSSFGQGTSGWTNEAQQAYYNDCVLACVDSGSEKITTPGAMINDQLSESLGGGWKRLEAADEINEVIGALIDYSLNKMRNGLISRYSGGQQMQSNTQNSNFYGAFRKTVTLADLKADIFKTKYSLYDSKTLQYDSGFKPGQDGNDPEAANIFRELYRRLKGDASTYDVNCQLENPDDKLDPFSAAKHPSGNAYDAGFWDKNCGVLAANTLRNKVTGDMVYAGRDLVKQSKGLAGPYSQALLWYRQFALKRHEVMMSELIDARAQALGNKDAVRCQYYGGRNLDYDTAKNLITTNISTLKTDIDDILDFYKPNSTYDNVMTLINKSEDDLSKMDPSATSTIQDISETILSLKARIPDLSEKITKRFDDMGFYAKGNSCSPDADPLTAADNAQYGYGELGCMARAEARKIAALTADPNAVFSKTDIQRFNGQTVDAASDANMHCWVQGPIYDVYGPASGGSTSEIVDTCNGDNKAQFTCGDNDVKNACTDAWTETGSAGGGSFGPNGGGINIGSETKYYSRTVTCVLGAGIDPNAGGGSGGGGKSGGPTYMCSSGRPSTPNPNTGENYFTVAKCTSKALCDTYYPGDVNCYGDLYTFSSSCRFGGSECAAIQALNKSCYPSSDTAWDANCSQGSDPRWKSPPNYITDTGGRYDCLKRQSCLP